MSKRNHRADRERRNLKQTGSAKGRITTDKK